MKTDRFTPPPDDPGLDPCLDSRYRTDNIPVNRKPAQNQARYSHQRELHFGNFSQIASAPYANAGYDRKKAQEEGQRSDKVHKIEPLIPARRRRVDVVARSREKDEDAAHQRHPD